VPSTPIQPTPVRSAPVGIRPRRVLRMLLLIILGLAVAGVVGQMVRYQVGCDGALWTLVKGFDLDREDNFPSWYSSMTLFVSALLLGVIAAWAREQGSRWARHWWWMSAAFVVISMDELLQLHERLIDPVRALLHLESSGVFHNAWVVPALAGVAVGGASYWSFLAGLPAKTRRLLLTAAAMYLAGAVGFEMLGGVYTARFGQEQLGYALLTAAEEVLEMIGIATLIYGLLDYIGANEIGLCVARPPTGSERDSQR
jgi:hypothetical protein